MICGDGKEVKKMYLLEKQPSDCEPAPAYKIGLFCPLSHNYGKAGNGFWKGEIRVGRRRRWEGLVCLCDTLLIGTVPRNFLIPFWKTEAAWKALEIHFPERCERQDGQCKQSWYQPGWWILLSAVGKARKKSEMMMFKKGTDREVFGGHGGRSK